MPARLPVILSALATLCCVVMLAACGGPARSAGEEAVPTFAPPRAGSAPVSPGQATLMPTDCADVLPASTMSALLGQPTDSVAVHTVVGQPAPSVGRLERISCLYQRTQAGPSGRAAGTRVGSPMAAAAPTGPVRGTPDLTMVFAAYSTPTAADAQLRTNSAAERSDARAVQDLTIGTARAVLFDEQVGTVLMVASGRSAITMTMRPGVVDPTQARSVLVDMAQRALPRLVREPAPEPR